MHVQRYWTKSCIGAHEVYLPRVSRGQRHLGLWELPNESGGFHIWPRGQGEGEEGHESAEEPVRVGAGGV